jgi:hypothetical protein
LGVLVRFLASLKISLQFIGVLEGLLIITFKAGQKLLGLSLLNSFGLNDFLLLFNENGDLGDLLSNGSRSGSRCCGRLGLGQLFLLTFKSADGCGCNLDSSLDFTKQSTDSCSFSLVGGFLLLEEFLLGSKSLN